MGTEVLLSRNKHHRLRCVLFVLCWPVVGLSWTPCMFASPPHPPHPNACVLAPGLAMTFDRVMTVGDDAPSRGVRLCKQNMHVNSTCLLTDGETCGGLAPCLISVWDLLFQCQLFRSYVSRFSRGLSARALRVQFQHSDKSLEVNWVLGMG